MDETASSPVELTTSAGLSVTAAFESRSLRGETIVLEKVTWREPSGSMRARRATVDASGAIHLKDVTWRLARRDTTLRAKEAHYAPASDKPGTWRFDDLRSEESVGLPLATSASAEGRSSGGLLPPTLRFRPGPEFELQLAALSSTLGAGPLIEIAPGLWYGLGAAVRSKPTAHTAPVLSAGLLEADLRWRSGTASPGWRITGRAHRGTGLKHGSIDLEAVSQAEFWRWEALDATTFGRRWRLSRFGASLSGPDWSLQLDADLYENDRLVAEKARDTGPTSLGLGLRYASDHALTPWLEAHVRLAHRSRVADSDAHATTLFAGLEANVGQPGRIVARAGAAVRASQRVTPTTAPSTTDQTIGFSTEPAAQLVTHANIQATLEGRFPDRDFVHRIVPSLRAVAAPLGAGPSSGETDALFPWMATRQEAWTAGAATLEQHFQFSDATLTVPAGLWLNDSGWNDGIDQWGVFARAHLQSSHLDLHGAIIHRAPVDGREAAPAWDAQAAVTVGAAPRVRIRYAPTSARPQTALLAQTDRLANDPAQAARLLQAGASSAFAAPRVQHRAGIRIAWRPIAATVDGLVDGAAERWGGAVGLEYPLETLGLALTLRSVFRHDPSTWGISLGFRPSSP
jgi:hypothetical protein